MQRFLKADWLKRKYDFLMDLEEKPTLQMRLKFWQDLKSLLKRE